MSFDAKVDFHSHYLSPAYYEYLDRYESEKPDCFATPAWNEQAHVKQMDALGIAFSFISVSSPNCSRAERAVERDYVRRINDEGAAIVNRYPDRLGLLASLPLPHVEDSIAEATYALDMLHADGFGLSTHYAGVYLGHPSYDPLMDWLDKRSAVITVHPVKPAALPQDVNDTVPIPEMEFFMDTTRTFSNMVMHNIFGRFPHIKWVFPHAGAFLPILSDRFSGFAVLMKQEHPELPLDFKGDMQHVYFDAAGFSLQKQLADLLKDVSIDNVVYGSDTPYTPNVGCVALCGGLEKLDWLSDVEKEKLFTRNALTIVPRLQDVLNIKADVPSINYAVRPLNATQKRGRRMRRIVASAYGKIFG